MSNKLVSPKVFIIDDDADDRELILEALSTMRNDAILGEFPNGKQLLDYLGSGKEGMPDVIVLDMNMPIKGGLDTLRELKASNTFEKIPVVILTTSSKPSDEECCYKLGVSKFFRKPSKVDEYAALAGTILSFALNI